MTGLIIRSLSGFYSVYSETGVTICRARGRFRKDGIKPLVGDRVEFTRMHKDEGRIDALLPRRNELKRPPVANIDALVIVISAAGPVSDPYSTDKLIVSAECVGIEPVIVLNKTDIDAGDELYKRYAESGYTVTRLSAATGEGINALTERITGKISAFTGNSGVGKTSILNQVLPRLNAAVGEVSLRLGRGRHTTRCTELFGIGQDTWIADTPGFSVLDLEPAYNVAEAFIEFRPFLEDCRFNACRHVDTDGCAVIQALNEGKIQQSRYDSFVRMKQAEQPPSY